MKDAEFPETSFIDENGHIVDKVDYPFVNDPEVIGGWKSVDFVQDINEFDPTKKSWKGDLFLNNLLFEEGGNIAGNILTWTKGFVLSEDTASKYIIREIDGSTYMFFEWKSGDYTIRHMRPCYYVLRKVLTESLKYEPMFGKKAHIPPTSTINEKGYIVDKIDYPFVNDPEVIGTWKSVDFVDEIEQFKVDEKRWKGRGGELFLHEMIFENNGLLISKNDNVKKGYSGTWTKGLVIYDNDTKTASKYTIKEIDGSSYMFYEWKSGDYTFRHQKPAYYVLKKTKATSEAEVSSGSAQSGKLISLFEACIKYARDHGKRYPDALNDIELFINEEDFQWLLENVEYLGNGKPFDEVKSPNLEIVAYDKTLLAYNQDTNVLFKDDHVDTASHKELRELLYGREKAAVYEKRLVSAHKLSGLGKAMLIFANDHDDKYPESLKELSKAGSVNENDLTWRKENVEYLGHNVKLTDRPVAVLAYDKTLLNEQDSQGGTNVLYNDSHVSFEKPETLKKLSIKTENSVGQIENLKRQLEEPITVHIDKSPDGDRLMIQAGLSKQPPVQVEEEANGAQRRINAAKWSEGKAFMGLLLLQSVPGEQKRILAVVGIATLLLLPTWVLCLAT